MKGLTNANNPLDFTIAADVLVERALESSNPEHVDILVRCAYGRYYYSCYLSVVDLLRMVEDRKDMESDGYDHAGLPKRLLKRKSKVDHIYKNLSDSTKANLYSQITSHHASIKRLASLLDEARTVRVSADYKSSYRISRIGGDSFSFCSVPLGAAKGWKQNIEKELIVIKRTYKSLGIL